MAAKIEIIVTEKAILIGLAIGASISTRVITISIPLANF